MSHTNHNYTICRHCGGTFGRENGRWVCVNCGRDLQQEEISNESTALLWSAYQKLRQADFFDAERAFEDIIFKWPNNAEAYWGRLMARYGIKYEDGDNNDRIATCCSAGIESVLSSSDYQKALEYATEQNRVIYQRQAAYIESIRKEWLKKASKEEPYDIFISFKDAEPDSSAMKDLYIYLTSKDYRVFFSPVSLRDKVGDKYEPYIYQAISTAKVMLVYGSKPEFIDSTWVKNEWMRYRKRMEQGDKKPNSLLVACAGFSPGELPATLSSMQCLDVDSNERRFYSDLMDAISRIIGDGDSYGARKKRRNEPQRQTACQHRAVVGPAIEPTCTQQGWTASVTCGLCGALMRAAEPIPAKGHSFGEWKLLKKATCTENGEHERFCHCGERETKKIPSRGGHTPGQWEIIKAATLTENGLKIKKCVVCGEKIQDFVIPIQRPTPVADSSESRVSSGLVYAVRADGQTCEITGIGTCRDTKIVIPREIGGHKVTGIGNNAFSWGGFSEIVIPDTVTSIGTHAFSNCAALTEISIPESVTKIGWGAFSYTKRLSAIHVAQGNPSYISVDGNLYTKNLRTLVHYAAGKSESAFIVPSGVTDIEKNAFGGSDRLTQVTLPDSVKSVGAYAFCRCANLSVVSIPASVTVIGNGAFSFAAVTEIHVSDTNPNYTSVDGNLYTKDRKTLLQYAAGKREASFSVPMGVTAINRGAFSGCAVLTSVILSETVQSIGDWAFDGCKRLKSVSVSENVTKIGDHAFNACSALSNIDYCGTEEQWNAMDLHRDWKSNSAIGEVHVNSTNPSESARSSGLAYTVNADGQTCVISGIGSCRDTRIAIPRVINGKKVTGIADNAFSWCKRIVSVEIPNTVTAIGMYAFSNCVALSDVLIPDSITAIGAGAFAYDASLAEIRVSDGNPNYIAAEGNLYTRNGEILLQYASGKQAASFTIPAGVKIIEKTAFGGAARLSNVTIPEGVTTIGAYAFCRCASLSSVSVPESVREIGDGAFSFAVSMTDIRVSESNPNYISANGNLYTKDGKILLQYAAGKASAYFRVPDSVTEIGRGAFSGASELTAVILGGSVTTVGDWAFDSCKNLHCVLIPVSATAIGDHAFNACTSLTSLDYCGASTNWSAIRTHADWNKGSLIKELHVNVPAAYPSIPSAGFRYTVNADGETCEITGVGSCSDADVVIPGKIDGKTVTSIGKMAFENSRTAKTIWIPETVTRIAEFAFYGCKALIDVFIPESVTRIEAGAFFGCTALTNVWIPAGVSVIGDLALACGVRKISVSSRNHHFTSADGNLYTQNKKTLLQYTKKDNPVFTVPSGVKEIGNGAFFYCSELEVITLPEGLTAICECAFNSCSELSGLVIPASVKTIGKEAFSECENLATLFYTGTQAQWAGMTIHSDWSKNSAVREIKFGKPDFSASDAASGLAYTAGVNGTCTISGIGTCTSSHLIIPHQINGLRVTGIGRGAFEGCQTITSVLIPTGVRSIGDRAFARCTRLVGVVIGKGTAGIGNEAFEKCTALANVSLPGSLVSIGRSAFGGCTSLASLNIPNCVRAIGAGAFRECTSLVSLNIPDSVTNIGAGAFCSCEKLVSAVIGRSITDILHETFANCTALSAVALPVSLRQIEKNAFQNCPRLESLRYSGTVKDWKKIKLRIFWKADSHIKNVICNGGSLKL